jgi:acetoin utilization deacetylase AcuC-like enzyme
MQVIMSSINEQLLANSKSKGKRPYFFDDPAVERVLNITLAVAMEHAVTRERLDTIERLLEAKGILSQSEIDTYEPDKTAAEERQRWHAEYIARILRIIQQELEALEHPENNRDIEDIAEELGQA